MTEVNEFEAKGKEIVKIIHKYMPVEGWIQAFIEDLNNAGFRIEYSPESPRMEFKKTRKQTSWSD